MATSNRPASSPLKKNWPPTLFPLATHHLKIVSTPLDLCRKHTGGLARQDQMVWPKKPKDTQVRRVPSSMVEQFTLKELR